MSTTFIKMRPSSSLLLRLGLAVVAGLVWALAWVQPATAANDYAVTHTLNRPIYIQLFHLDDTETYEFRLTEITEGAIPVMRLYWMGADSDFYQEGLDGYYKAELEVALGEDVGNDVVLGFRGEDFPAGAQSDSYFLLVVHALHEDVDGTATLKLNGQTVGNEPINFGGNVTWHPTTIGPGAEFRTIMEPLDGAEHQMVVAVGPADVGFGTHVSWNFLEPTGVHWTWQEPGTQFDNFPTVFATITSDFDAGNGATTMTVADNSLIHDEDGDKVGDDLEAYLGMCYRETLTTPTWDCAYSVLDDTDTDGLTDFDELFGDLAEGHPLHRWGASPVHKDVFVEVDHDTLYLGTPETDFGLEWATDIVNVFAGGSAAELHNPDGEDGVRFHFDVVGSPGINTATNPALVFDGGGSGPTLNGTPCANYGARRDDSQDSARHDLFHYLCVADPSAVGQGGEGNQIPAMAMVSNGEARQVSHELGHNFGLRHGGLQDGEPSDVLGFPNYYSLMNYAFYDYSELSHGEASALQPEALCEETGVGLVTPAHLGAGSSHRFAVSGTGIDWNRDGTFSACTVDVRADVLTTPFGEIGAGATGSHCHGAADTAFSVEGSVESVSIVRFDDSVNKYLYVFYTLSGGDDVYYRRALVSDGFMWLDAPTEFVVTDVARGVAAAAFNDAVYVAVTLDSGVVEIYRGDLGTGGVLVADPVTELSEAFSPEAVDMVAFDGRLFLAGRVADSAAERRMWVTFMDASENWEPLDTVTHQVVSGCPFPTPPGCNPFTDVDVLCRKSPSLAVRGDNDTLNLSCVDDAYNVTIRQMMSPHTRWEIREEQPSTSVFSNRRATLHWSENGIGGGAGNWYIAYAAPIQFDPAVTRVLTWDGSHDEWIDSFFCWRNSQTTSYVDLDQLPGDASAYAVSSADEQGNDIVFVAPYADAVVPWTLDDVNDFERIGQNTAETDWTGPGICGAIARYNSRPCAPGIGGVGGGTLTEPFEAECEF